MARTAGLGRPGGGAGGKEALDKAGTGKARSGGSQLPEEAAEAVVRVLAESLFQEGGEGI